jgi:hypothetical protein
MSVEATMSDSEDILLDRRHISLISTEVLGPGARVSVAKIEKLAMCGEGPPVDYLLGPKMLTKKRNACAWLRSLLRTPSAAVRIRRRVGRADL